jgi:hypothetical protein
MSAEKVPQNSAATPDKRFEVDGESRVKKLADAQIPTEMAKAQLGRAFRRTVRGSDKRSKEFGDPGQVSRLGSGDWPEPIVNAWRDEESRRDLLRNLARESGLFDEQVSLNERKRASGG